MLKSLTALPILLFIAPGAQAQSAYCPSSVAGLAGTPDQGGFALSNGACTNGGIGAFSGAALGSQALSDLSQTATQESSRNAVEGVRARRNAEAERPAAAPRREDPMPPSARRASERAQPRPAPTAREQPAPKEQRAARTERAQPRAAPTPTERSAARTERRAEVVEAPTSRLRSTPRPARQARIGAEPAVRPRADTERTARTRVVLPAEGRRAAARGRSVGRPVGEAVESDAGLPIFYGAPVPMRETRFSVWAQGFGDFEERTGRGTSNINCCTNAPLPGVQGIGLPSPLLLSVRSRSNTAGFTGGIDLTARDLATPGDGVLFGLLTGYLATSVDLTSSAISTKPDQIPNGFGRLRAQLSGPSAGFFTTYFNGGFSTDLTLKIDVFSLNERFFDQLGFSANFLPSPGGLMFRSTSTVPFLGTAATGLTNGSVIGNVNYRLPLTEVLWIEPTAGFRYTSSHYAQNAQALGLNDGYLIRVQGGARLGLETYLTQTTRLTTLLTGLAYSDVVVTGGFIPSAGFVASDILARSDQGKLRGQGLLTMNLDFGNGVSSFVQGEVRGGQNLFGYGGKSGVRVAW